MKPIESLDYIHKKSLNGLRWYYNIASKVIEESFRPSVTSIIGRAIPKGPALETWMKNMGHFSDVVRDTSAVIGTMVHMCIEDLLRGIKIDEQYMRDIIGRYPRRIWVMKMDEEELMYKLRRYMESYMSFYDKYQPTIIGNELKLWDWDIGWGGQTDQLYMIKNKAGHNKPVLIDNKTGSQQTEKHLLQQTAYKILLEKMYGIEDLEIGILYVRESYRKDPTHTLKIGKPDVDYWNDVYAMFCRMMGDDDMPKPKVKPQPRKEFFLNLNNEETTK